MATKRSLEDKIELGLKIALVLVMLGGLIFVGAPALLRTFTQQHAHEVSDH